MPLANQIVMQPDRISLHKSAPPLPHCLCFNSHVPKETNIDRCYGQKICMFMKPGNSHPQVQQDGDVVVLGAHVTTDTAQRDQLAKIEDLGGALMLSSRIPVVSWSIWNDGCSGADQGRLASCRREGDCDRWPQCESSEHVAEYRNNHCQGL